MSKFIPSKSTGSKDTHNAPLMPKTAHSDPLMSKTIKKRPLMSIKDWLRTYLTVSLPVVGVVMLFIWAFTDSANEVKQTWARAMLIFMVVSTILLILFYVVIFTFLYSINPTGGNF